MDPQFYPLEANVPAELKDDTFWLRPLRIGDATLDYEALMVSVEMLRRWGGGSWPEDSFTVEDNVQDLAMHEREHLAREAFTYTVLTPSGDQCLGCVYLDPLARVLSMGGIVEPEIVPPLADYQAVARFWVRQTRLADELDRQLFAMLVPWLRSAWHFGQVYFRTNEWDVRQVKLLEDAGLRRHYVVDVPDRQGRFWIYGRLLSAW